MGQSRPWAMGLRLEGRHGATGALSPRVGAGSWPRNTGFGSWHGGEQFPGRQGLTTPTIRTTSKSPTRTALRVLLTASFHRASAVPERKKSLPLSATIIP